MKCCARSASAEVGPPGPCEGFAGPCGSTVETAWESSRTAYHHEPGTPCRNAPIVLCRDCAFAHHEHWDEMWRYARGA